LENNRFFGKQQMENIQKVAHSIFTINQWDEKPYQELPDGTKYTRSSVAYCYKGDIEGESTLEYLMYYRTDGSGEYTGFERIVGCIGGRKGSVVLYHHGTFDNEAVNDTFNVVPNSGTEELQGLVGGGTEKLVHAAEFPLVLHFSFGQ
jgi:hypothetical protein